MSLLLFSANRALVILAITVASGASKVSAQMPARPDEPSVCLGFAFGSWTPALDWSAAGHVSPINPRATQHAGDGRDWASTQAVENEHTIVLLPSWWPAGVQVTLPNRAPALGDTVQGTAFAFIADGRREVPRAQVRAWRVDCGKRGP
jgi:hypothetical protein